MPQDCNYGTDGRGMQALDTVKKGFERYGLISTVALFRA